MPMRTLAIADVYEALTSARPYRPAMTSARALEIIRADVPERLDAHAFSALETLLDRGADIPSAFEPREGEPGESDAWRAHMVLERDRPG